MRPNFILSIVLLTAALKTFAQHEVPIDSDSDRLFEIGWQEKRDSIETRAWKTSEFIFEGTVVSTKKLCDDNNADHAFLSHLLVVERSLKGELNQDTVEVIADYSNLSGCQAGVRYQPNPSNMDQSGPRIYKKEHCLILANKFQSTGIDVESQTNGLILQFVSSIRTGFYSYLGEGKIHGFGKNFKTGSSLTSYLREKNLIDETTEVFPNKMEKVPPKKEEKTRKELLEEIRLKSEETYWSERNQEALRRGDSLIERGKQRYEELQKKKPGNSPIELKLSIVNEFISGNSDSTYYEFDLEISASEGGTFLEGAGIDLSFQLLFNFDQLELTLGPDFSSYNDPILGAMLVEAGRIRYVVDTRGTKKEITETPQLLTHLKIHLLGNECSIFTNNVGLNLSPHALFLTTYSSGPLADDFEFYDDITLYSPESIELCPYPVIHSIETPPSLIPGYYYGLDEITLYGEGFGDSKRKGNVLFTDQRGEGFVGANSIDFVSWNHNKIVLRVPSMVLFWDQDERIYRDVGPAGSGPIRLINDWGFESELSGQILDIPYSIRTFYSLVPDSDSIIQDKNPIRLFDARPSDNAVPNISFFISSELDNHPDWKATIERAMADWSCASGINWSIGGVKDGNQSFVLDNINYISLIEEFPNPSGLGGTTILDAYLCTEIDQVLSGCN